MLTGLRARCLAMDPARWAPRTDVTAEPGCLRTYSRFIEGVGADALVMRRGSRVGVVAHRHVFGDRYGGLYRPSKR